MTGKVGGSRNFTSTVSPSKTAQNIVAALAKHGADGVSLDFGEGGEPAAVTFRVTTEVHGVLSYRLPVDVEAMHAYLRRQVADSKIDRRFSTHQQAARTAWRVCEDWLTSQLAMVAAGQAVLEQTMLPYLLVDSIGTTVYDRFVASGLRELEASSG